MPDKLDHARLKEKQRRLREGFPDSVSLRVHRAISWIGRAEGEEARDDPDARFIFLWIAFNAAYADDADFQGIRPEEQESLVGADPERSQRSPSKERKTFTGFFGKVAALDHGRRIYNAIWGEFSGPIRVLMDNRYVFGPFWKHRNGVPGFERWEDSFRGSKRRFHRAVSARNDAQILAHLFERLYVLRNQIVHGGATWNGSANRDQVRDGAAILGFLTPVFVDIMMDNPEENWGRPCYPVVDRDNPAPRLI